MRKLKYVKLFEEMNQPPVIGAAYDHLLDFKDFSKMKPEEVVNKLIPYLDMKYEVSFNIQLDPEDPENPGKSILRIWNERGEIDNQLRITIERDKYEELLSLLTKNYGCFKGRYIPNRYTKLKDN